MTDQFLSEIRLFAGNFAPVGWALCDGQLIAISQNTALFSLLGTTYGGDGRTNFALPNLQASVPIQAGQGAGLSLRNLGDVGGVQAVTLIESELAAHTHVLSASTNAANTGNPDGALLAAPDPSNPIFVGAPGTPLDFGPLTVGTGGPPGAHNNLQPYLVITFIIALQGIFPARS
jgi:microcystin-dependent protein